MTRQVPARIANILINALKGGVVPRAGLEYITVGRSQEIAAMMTQDLQERVAIAGLEILEGRITHLSYAPEVAAARLGKPKEEIAALFAALHEVHLLHRLEMELEIIRLTEGIAADMAGAVKKWF